MNGLLVKYFVLRPGKDDVHGSASRAAMHTYANNIGHSNPKLAKDILKWVTKTERDIEASKGR